MHLNPTVFFNQPIETAIELSELDSIKEEFLLTKEISAGVEEALDVLIKECRYFRKKELYIVDFFCVELFSVDDDVCDTPSDHGICVELTNEDCAYSPVILENNGRYTQQGLKLILNELGRRFVIRKGC